MDVLDTEYTYPKHCSSTVTVDFERRNIGDPEFMMRSITDGAWWALKHAVYTDDYKNECSERAPS